MGSYRRRYTTCDRRLDRQLCAAGPLVGGFGRGHGHGMTAERDPSTFGGLLRAFRERAGLSQQELAGRAGLGVRTVRELERDRVARPRVPSVERLAAALALSASDRGDLLAALGPGAAGAGSWRLRVEVLGPLTVRRSGVAAPLESAQQRTLLGLLALHPRQVVPVSEIVNALWGTDPPRSSPQLVHLYVGQLRRLLEPGRAARTPSRVLRRAAGGYALDLDQAGLDLAEFDDLVRRAHDDDERGLTLLDRALALWRGPVLGDVGARLSAHPSVVAVAGRRIGAGLAFADLAIERGRYGEVVDRLRPLAAAEPLHEGVAARLMVALAGAGEKAAALGLFEEIGRRLSADLGVEPGPELRAAHLRVLREEHPPPAGTAARRATDQAPAQLPVDNAAFAGRTDPLKVLDDLLTDRPTTAVICAISGTAGVGKTTLAVHWAHRVRDRFPDGQLYVNLRGFDPDGAGVEPAEAVRGFLDAFGVPAERMPADLAARVGLYRSVLSRRRVLVLLDNARDAEQVRPLLPAEPGCLALVTSRNRLASLVAVEGAHPVPLDLLDPDESRQLLGRRLGSARTGSDPGAVDAIVSRCANLPLALAIAAARAAIDPGLPMRALADELAGATEGLSALDAGDAVTRVRAVFSWSYRRLRPAAARLFRLLGRHPGPDFSASAAASLAASASSAGRPDVGRQLLELVDANLLGEPRPGRFVCHDLLRAYASEQALHDETATDLRAATGRMLDHYLHTAYAAALVIGPHRDPVPPPAADAAVAPEPIADRDAAMAWFGAEYPVLRGLVDLAVEQGFDAHVWHLAWAVEDFLDWRGHWSDWVATLHAAVAAAERLGQRGLQARSHQNLGLTLARLGRYDDAEAHLHRALDLFDADGYRLGLAYVHHNLGMLFSRLERHHEALRHSELSLREYEAVDDPVGQASALNAIGWHHVQLGDHRMAIEHCRRALALLEATEDRYGQANTWDSIGLAHHELGELAQATRSYRRAIAYYREVGDRWGEANTLDRLGDTHRAAGRAASARDAWRRAAETLDQIGDAAAEQVRAKLR
jgi:DNA-binding SARP family transcriptional activator/Tfp pilus assembly protein PilF/DNA-binding XRE family transcriptional regulator